jgi:hypothetical protein
MEFQEILNKVTLHGLRELDEKRTEWLMREVWNAAVRKCANGKISRFAIRQHIIEEQDTLNSSPWS